MNQPRWSWARMVVVAVALLTPYAGSSLALAGGKRATGGRSERPLPAPSPQSNRASPFQIKEAARRTLDQIQARPQRAGSLGIEALVGGLVKRIPGLAQSSDAGARGKDEGAGEQRSGNEAAGGGGERRPAGTAEEVDDLETATCEVTLTEAHGKPVAPSRKDPVGSKRHRWEAFARHQVAGVPISDHPIRSCRMLSILVEGSPEATLAGAFAPQASVFHLEEHRFRRTGADYQFSVKGWNGDELIFEENWMRYQGPKVRAVEVELTFAKGHAGTRRAWIYLTGR